MRSLITLDGALVEPTRAEVERRLAAKGGEPFWLDIERPGEEDFELLRDVFHFHPLTIEDVRSRSQRPTINEFGEYAFVVLFCAELRDDDLAFQEHHLYMSRSWLVTIHGEPAPALEEVRQQIRAQPDLARRDLGFLKYLVTSALVESLFPVLLQLDERVDALEETILRRSTPRTLSRLNHLRHSVAELRRILGSQRDVVQRLLTHTIDATDRENALYWRDVYDDLIREFEQADTLRDLLAGAMDVYLSTVSNRLNTTMKQLTVIASLFLPLTFLTGFFGMNFAFMVNLISPPGAFAAGLTLMALTTLLQLFIFWRRGWL